MSLQSSQVLLVFTVYMCCPLSPSTPQGRRKEGFCTVKTEQKPQQKYKAYFSPAKINKSGFLCIFSVIQMMSFDKLSKQAVGAGWELEEPHVTSTKGFPDKPRLNLGSHCSLAYLASSCTLFSQSQRIFFFLIPVFPGISFFSVAWHFWGTTYDLFTYINTYM